MNRSQEIVLLIVQHIIRHCNTRGHKFCDTSLNELLSELRVFKLVTDSNTLTCPDQFWKICIKSVMRKSGHLVALIVTIITMSKSDTQYLCSRNGILTVCLVKITTTEQQHSIRMLCLKVEKLLHHRGEFTIFLCHYLCFFIRATKLLLFSEMAKKNNKNPPCESFETQGGIG